MKLVIQRVKQALVTVADRKTSSIGQGIVVLLGIHKDDTKEEVVTSARKIAHLRIMADAEGKMNRSVKDVNDSVLVVSQFTLLADTTKGNRPSFIDAADPQKAKQLYELFIKELKKEGIKNVKSGKFGAYMQVKLINDGPVTIVI
jgi:D-tyrosyl-tRNA(Tyr) deacylase